MIAMIMRTVLPLVLASLVAGCGASPKPAAEKNHAEGADADHEGKGQMEAGHEKAGHDDEAEVILSQDQIAAAGIQLDRPTAGNAGTIELPATIEGDPGGMYIVSAAIGGRIVALHRNLGQAVARGTTIAVIESREAAQMKGGAAAARIKLDLAVANLAREERLFAARVSPKQDVLAARSAAAEARVAYRQATAQVSATGSGGSLNRIGIAAPIAGQVIARPVVLGQVVAADTELYRIANLSQVSLSFSLKPQDAGRVAQGANVTVTAPGRQTTARISFISPALDAQTRQVPAIAVLENRGNVWRIGEPVTAAIQLSGSGGTNAIRVPLTAVQTVDGKRAVFVRTEKGFRMVPVDVGDTAGDNVIIRSGLTGRERIATTGSFTLKAELGKGEAPHEDH